MRNIFKLIMIAAFSFFIFSCQVNEEEQARKDSEIRSLRFNGGFYLENGRLAEAEDVYQKLVDLAPDDAAAYASLTLIYLKQNKYKRAKANLNKALKKAPDNPDIKMISARYFELNQEQAKAIGVLEDIIVKHPDYIIAPYNLARLYEQSATEDAFALREKYLTLTIKKAPGNIVPRLELISLLIRKGDHDDAIVQLENLSKIFAEFPKEAARFYDKTMAALHASDLSTAATMVISLQNFLKVTAQYQSDLRDLKGPDSDNIGNYVFSLGDLDLDYAKPGESIINRIRFLDVSEAMNLNGPSGKGQVKVQKESALSQFALGDYDNDGYVDVYFSSYSSQDDTSVRRLLWNLGTTFQEQSKVAGINHSGRETASAFGDFDNDGFLDLYIVKDGSNVLYKNKGEGNFSNVSVEAGVGDNGPGNKAVFLDADHDGDLDLLVTRPASNLLYRNNSDGTFSEMALEMGLGLPVSKCGDAAFADFDEDGDLDLLMTQDEASGVLFSNNRHGTFSNMTSGSRLQDSRAAQALAIADYNNDGFLDFLLLSKSPGMAGIYANLGDGTFKPEPTPWLKGISNLLPMDAAFFDFDNDGFLDLLIAGKPLLEGSKSVFLFHNDSKGSFTDVSHLLPSNVHQGLQIETADFDKDGDLDVFVADAEGDLHLLQNEGGNLNHYLSIQLLGLRNGSSKNNHFGIGAKVEIRAGDLYQMKVVTEPVIHFGLGSRLKADVMRVIWTNGVAQNRFFPGSDEDLLEMQMLKGSCAFLYTWNGEGYVFLKDMMWRSALGMPLGIMGANTIYAPSDPSKEYLKIPGEQMILQDGRYIVQITEELWETAYFDNLELIVLDHPQNEQLFVDEKFTLPPYSDQYDLYSVQKKRLPVSAVDGAGTNLLPQIFKKDDVYISNFQLSKYQGIAQMHDLLLDPGGDVPSGDLMMYLNGWIFPSDASINYSLGQSSAIEVIPPQLQVVDKHGGWVTVIPNIGFPMGKDKTMIVDLTGKFLSNDRRVKIRTNMEIYWDEIFFSPKERPSAVTAVRLKPRNADLHYRGFSKLYRKGGHYGPHWFEYNDVYTGQKWRDLIGDYTRFGDVTPLLTATDDKLVIMNSGDEMTVSFDGTKLPALNLGWTRDFLIYSEGWIKDGDFNTAHGKTVAPLPFHGMTMYPYGDDESFPSDAIHQEYLETYNTRKVNTQVFGREILDFTKKEPFGEN